MAQKQEDTRTQTTKRRTLRGVVVSQKMKDTAVVAVARYVRHPKYKKYMRNIKRYKVHNPGNTKAIGENVVIQECRPLSKTKRFILVE